MAIYSIKDLEKISGIKAHTLRIWEQRYSILCPSRTDTNIRCYCEEDLKLVLSISMLNINGYKISRIAKMSREQIHSTCHSLFDQSDDYVHQVNALTLSMIELNEERFEKVISSAVLHYGFEETMLRIIYPFFERVGILWQTGTILPAQEHFISVLIRQKLIVAIDGQVVVRREGTSKYLLFLPEFELHEHGLLFACYTLRSWQKKVIYLGQNVPEEDLTGICNMYEPDYLVSVMTMEPPKESMETYVNRLAETFKTKKLLLTGSALKEISSFPPNVIYLKDPVALGKFLKEKSRIS